jgi:TolB-like protein/AraC-like DNA-binding protein/Tfp pilus assembly protein PilF
MKEPFIPDQIFIRKLTEIIMANLRNENFGVKEFAHESGLSIYVLTRRLHTITNKSINQFIRETRLQKALELLQKGEVTATEIAYKVGFGSPAYFNKCFHEFFGYPPGKVKIGEVNGTQEINSIQNRVNQEHKQSPGRTVIIALSSILLLTVLVFLIYRGFLKSSSAEVSMTVKSLEKSLAVLPFKNLSNNIEDQYFIDGLTEEILTDLSRIHDLRVISRTSVEQFRESTKSTFEIAKKLNVKYLVEGSGQKEGNEIRLRVQLIEANHDKHLWAESYEKEIKEIKDIFKIQSQIAQEIASALNVTITPEEKQLIEKIPTKSLIAHDLYVRGQKELDSSSNREAIKRAGHLYNKALKYDSAFAEAYLGLANVYWVKIDLERNIAGKNILDRYLDSMLVLTSTAISLDDKLSFAYYVRGGCYYNKGDERQALEDWDKAIKYNPNDYSSYWCKGWFYESHDLIKSIDNFERAALLYNGSRLPEILTRIGGDYYMAGFPKKGNEYLLEALKLDGDSVKYLDSYFYYLAENQGKYQKMINYLEKGCQTDSTNDLIILRLGFYNSIIGKYRESLKYYKKYINGINKSQLSTSMDIRKMEYHIGYIYKQNGFRKEADNYLNKSIDDYKRFINSSAEHEKRIYVYRLAAAYACKGDKEKAYENLKILGNEQCFVLRDLTLIKNDPLFIGIRNEPEFRQIVRDMEAKYQAEHERVRRWIEEHKML